MLGALQNRNFRLLWIGSVSAFVAFFTSNVVQAVVAFELTAENRAVGMVVFGRGLGQLLLAPLGGALADRLDKRVLLVLSQSMTAAVFFALAWLMAAGRMQIVHLTAGGFLIGLTFAVLGPARSAYIVDLVEPERRGNAVAMNQVALNFARVVGPALAGPLLSWATFGPTAAFGVMGVLYAFALVTQLPLPSSRATAPREDLGLLADVRDGLAYVRRSPRLRSLLLLFVLTIMLGFPYVTVLPGLVEHQLGQPSQRVSVLFAVSAVGGLLASIVVAPIADSKHAIAVYRASGAAFGASVALLSLVRSFEQAVALLVLIGLTSGVFTTLNGAVLIHTDPRYFGRVMSLAMLAFGAFGLVGVPVGALADALGEGRALGVLGALVCAVVALQRVREPGPAELGAQAGVSRP